MAASNSWDLFHIDLKTAFLQGQSCKTEETCMWHERCSRRWWNITEFFTVACASLGTLDTRGHRTAERHERDLHWITWAIRNGSCIWNNAGSDSWKSSYRKISGRNHQSSFWTGGNEVKQRVLTRFRTYFHVQEVVMLLLTFQSKIAWQIASQRLQPRRTIWSQPWRQDNCCMLTFTLISEHLWSTIPSCLRGAEHLCTQGRRKFPSWTRLKISLAQTPQEGPLQVMFVETQQTKEQKELNTRERKAQDATKITSAPAESCIPFLWSVMPISMTALTWMVKNTDNRNTIEDFTEEIDEAGFVRQYNFSRLLLRI